MLIAFILLLLYPCPSFSAKNNSHIKIGVLAYRGAEQAMRMWNPTAEYLNDQIPDHAFSIVPLDFQRINSAVGTGEVDFILANSSIYVELENLFNVNRIATAKKIITADEGFLTVFGGVIFTRADRKDIRSLEDLKGRSFIAVDETSLGGWRVAWRQMKEQGFDPYRNLKSLSFAGTHDAAVFAVRDGKADAGTVRTDILESLQRGKRIDMNEFRILNRKQYQNFPFVVSTRLYPEWPFAKVKHTSNELSQRVAVALMMLPRASRAAQRAELAGWTIPLDYEPVHELLRELRLTPYENYGKISLGQALRQYWYAIVIGIVLMFAAFGTAVYIYHLNAVLKDATVQLESSQRELETKVEERTIQLRSINTELEGEIAQRRESEEALKESERRFRETFEHANLVAVQLDMEGRIIFANAYLSELTHWKLADIIGHDWFDLYIPEQSRKIARRLHQKNTSGEMVGEHINEIKTRNGGVLLISWTNSQMLNASGRLIGITSLGMDITHQRQMEKYLFNAQKLEAVGTLAGGIAHDFNNLLQGIFGYISMAKINLLPDSKAYRFLHDAEASLGIATNLTGQLLTFSKGGQPVKKILPLEPVISNAVKLGLSGSRADFSMMLDDNLWLVEIDAGQIGQVIQNIIINANDAMPQGGTVEISARNVPNSIPGLTAPKFVKIVIEDTGSGIPEDVLKKIFDPYFTTKERGSGLGLATAYSIIRNHGGRIEVESVENRGSKFIIYLPAVSEGLTENEGSAQLAVDRCKAKVLVMDDEIMLRNISSDMLRELGHDVEVASHGEEALAKYQSAIQQGTPFDIVILDLTIRGGMGGEETNTRLHEIDPQVKTIMSSGYSDGATMSGYQELGFSWFLKKPYNFEDLKQSISALLS